MYPYMQRYRMEKDDEQNTRAKKTRPSTEMKGNEDRIACPGPAHVRVGLVFGRETS